MGITQTRLPATRVAAGRLLASAFRLLASGFWLLNSDPPVLPYFVANSTVVRKTSRARSSMISGVMISIASFVV